MLQRVLFEFGEIVQTRVSVLPLISKYRQAGWKYEAQPSFFSPVCLGLEIRG